MATHEDSVIVPQQAADHEEPAPAELGDPPSEFYDIMLMGRTGMGKSTTGNKLLCVDNAALDAGNGGRFTTGEGADSVTGTCDVLYNEQLNIRVLDTPGLADSKTSKEGVLKGNLQTFRRIMRAQEEHDLAFSRVVYFYPHRGPGERADGALQEEIKVMYEFLGDSLFKIMAIIATNPKGRYQSVGFTDEDKRSVGNTFMAAYENVAGHRLSECPPVVYLSTEEKDVDVINKIVGAQVIYEEPLKKPLTIDVTQSVSPSMVREVIREARQRNPGRKLKFEDVCIRCTAKLFYMDTPLGRIVAEVKESNSDTRIPPNESKCHPYMIPKHATVIKFVGGIAHILTLGIFAAIGRARKKVIWPGFTNHQEVCLKCNRSPGENACSEVGKTVEMQTNNNVKISVMTDHSTNLDRVQLETA